jgi:small subunit ribosomal protein S1
VGPDRRALPRWQRIKGKITNLVPYGAFVEIEEGVEGLIHVSELSWTKRIMRPSDILSVGQEVEAVVLGVNKKNRKFHWVCASSEANPWDEIEKKFTIGSRVKGKIRNMTCIRRVRGIGRRHRWDDSRLRSELDPQDQSSQRSF